MINVPNQDIIMTFGGRRNGGGTSFGNSPGSSDMLTWSFNYSENSWTNITPKSMPGVYIEHAAMVYLNNHNTFIHYGGCCSNQTLELILNK